MTKHLTLLRHAKAARGDPGLDDFDRPLNDKGREAAPRIGALMSTQGMAPDCALCSSSRRTRETFALVAPRFEIQPHALYLDRLYHASPSAILAAVESAPEQAAHVLVVGHNPGLHLFAMDFIDPAKSDKRLTRRLDEKFPTCAFAHFEIDIAIWTEIAGARGALRHFARPKDLDD